MAYVYALTDPRSRGTMLTHVFATPLDSRHWGYAVEIGSPPVGTLSAHLAAVQHRDDPERFGVIMLDASRSAVGWLVMPVYDAEEYACMQYSSLPLQMLYVCDLLPIAPVPGDGRVDPSRDSPRPSRPGAVSSEARRLVMQRRSRARVARSTLVGFTRTALRSFQPRRGK